EISERERLMVVAMGLSRRRIAASIREAESSGRHHLGEQVIQRAVHDAVSPHFSRPFVARQRREAWMRGASWFRDEGLVDAMSRSETGLQRSRQAAIRCPQQKGREKMRVSRAG